MNNKEKIEILAKKIGAKNGYDCKPEERCDDCLLKINCPCREYAKIVIDLGYDDANMVRKSTSQHLLAVLKSHAYYPVQTKGSYEHRIVDEDDIEKEIKQFVER